MPSIREVDVILVEDDRVLSEMLVRAIGYTGASIDATAGAAEAMRLLARGRYKVLVLDLFLPDGNGYEILDYIRAEKLPSLQIVVITAADPALLVKIDRSMVKTVVFKPFDIQQFAESIAAFAHGGQARLTR